jgi:hypothetical protein
MTKNRSIIEGLSVLELNRIAPPPECERLSGADWDTLKRNYPDKVVRISKRRVGMRVKDALCLDE